MAKDAILDEGTERIPRRPLPYFDEQDDNVGLIGGIIVGATMIALPIMIFIFACPGSATEARANAISPQTPMKQVAGI